MKTQSVTTENLEVLAEFKKLSAAYDAILTKQLSCELKIDGHCVRFYIDLSQEEVGTILKKKLKELATKIEKM